MRDHHIKSAERVLNLFEYFALHQRSASISELSQALNIPQSSMSMLVKNLVTMGYLEVDSCKRLYKPTLRITLLGDWIQQNQGAGETIVHLLDNVRKETKEAVALSIRNDIFAQYILVLDALDDLRLHITSGMMRPITRCAAGIIFLAKMDDDRVIRITHQVNGKVKKEEHKTKDKEIIENVEAARRQGFFMTDGHMTQGASSIAVEVQTPFSQSPMAVSVGGPRERIYSNKKTILKALENLQDAMQTQSAQDDIGRLSLPEKDNFVQYLTQPLVKES